MEELKPFYGLEFWSDVNTFKSTRYFDATKLQHTAQYIHKLYLRSNSEKKIFLFESPELEKLLKEVWLSIQEERATKNLFDDLVAFLTNYLKLDSLLLRVSKFSEDSKDAQSPKESKSKDAKSRIQNYYQDLGRKDTSSSYMEINNAETNSIGSQNDIISTSVEKKTSSKGPYSPRLSIGGNLSQGLRKAVREISPWEPRDKEFKREASAPTPSVPEASLQSNELASINKITAPFNRMMKITVLGSEAHVGHLLSLFPNDDCFVLGETLINLNPFRTSKKAENSRFFQNIYLKNPGFIIYTSFSTISRYKYLKGFSKSPYLVVDVTGKKDDTSTEPKHNPRFNYSHIQFEKTQNSTLRREILMMTMELIVRERKESSLFVEVPSFLHKSMNGFLRFRHMNKITTANKISNYFLDSICSFNQGTGMKHEGLDTFLGYFSVCVYEDAVIQNRKLLNQDEISVYTLKELLLKIYKIDLNVLESCSIFIRANQTIEQLKLETLVKDLISRDVLQTSPLHVFPNLKSFQSNLIKVFDKTGWIFPVTPDELVSEFYLTDLETITSCMFHVLSQTETPSLTISMENMRSAIETSVSLGSRRSPETNAKEVLLTFLHRYELIYFNQIQFFIPYLVLGHRDQKNLFFDFVNTKREKSVKRYFVISREMPLTFFDQLFSLLYSNDFVANFQSYYWFSQDTLLLFYKLNNNSNIVLKFDANTLMVAFSGNASEIVMFCTFCDLIRKIIRNFYGFNLVIQEIAECAYCTNDAFTLEFLFQTWISKGCLKCQDSYKTMDVESIAPDFFLPHVRRIQTRITDDKLGEGAFGLVYRGYTEDGAEVAVKKFKSPTNVISWAAFREFQHEAIIANDLDNKYLLRQCGVDIADFALVTEIAKGGVLGDMLHKSTAEISIQLRKKISLDIIQGLNYLHTLKPPIVHRDLRSFNIFVMSTDLGEDVNCKIGDFGLSLRLFAPVNEALESWQWIAPEVISGKPYHTPSDIYSFGILIYEIFSRVLPFTDIESLTSLVQTPLPQGPSAKEQIESLQKQGFKIENKMLIKREFNFLEAKEKICSSGLRPLIPEDFLPRLIQFLGKCWDDKPSKRSTAESLMIELKCFEFSDFLSGVRTSRDISNLFDSINNQIEQARMFRGRNPEAVAESEASTRMKEKEMLDNLKIVQRRLSSLALVDDVLDHSNLDNDTTDTDADTFESTSPRDDFISISPRMKSLPAIPTEKTRNSHALSSPPTSERKIPSKITMQTESAVDREMSPRQYIMQQQHQQLLQHGQLSPRSRSPFRPSSAAPNRPLSPRDNESITISKNRPLQDRPFSSPARSFPCNTTTTAPTTNINTNINNTNTNSNSSPKKTGLATSNGF